MAGRISDASREFAQRLIDTEHLLTTIRCRDENGVLREYRGVSELVEALKPDNLDQAANSQPWMLAVCHAVERMLDDARDVIVNPEKHDALYAAMPSALGLLMQSPGMFQDVSPFDAGSQIFMWWRESVSFSQAELQRRREAQRNRKLQAAIALADEAAAAAQEAAAAE